MADDESFFEIKDTSGSTEAFSGVLANNVTADVPAVAGNIIAQVMVLAVNRDLDISFDGGSSYFTIPRRDSLSWPAKGNITQIRLRGTGNNTRWRALLNLENHS